MGTMSIRSGMRGKLVAGGVAAVAAFSAVSITHALTPAHAQLGYQHLTPVHLTAETTVIRADAASDGTSLIVTASGSLGNYEEGALQATCPSGYQLTGGGTSIGPVASDGTPEGIENAYVTASYAEHSGSTSNNTWLGVATNVSGSTLTLTVQAVCG